MINYIFDLDDTIIIHNKFRPLNYNSITEDIELSNILKRCDDKGNCFIYTNGTGSHAIEVIKKMNIYKFFDKIYSRDTITLMKPNIKSFISVNNDIINRYPNTKTNLFFDDLLDNLYTAYNLGWITIWININNDNSKYEFVNYSFKNLKEALIYLENNL